MDSDSTQLVKVDNVSKTYGQTRVVDGVSFEVASSEIFGLIGPNGAGKTTTIRMMMDIIKPDSGRITIRGHRINESSKNCIGYLPEERGLYRKMTVIDTLTYLGSLKGLDQVQARQRAETLLNHIDMFAHRNKKIEELSRGMGQLIQFLVTIIHEPALLILDEPFGGLDPVNTQVIKEVILEQKNSGRGVILSTHRMNEIEALCDRIFMINLGRNVLYGKLADVKSRFKNNSVILDLEGDIPTLDGVSSLSKHRDYTELFLSEGTDPEIILRQLVASGIRVRRFEVSTPSLDEIFRKVAAKKR